jgi:OmpA-OmpF porin, OOP family
MRELEWFSVRARGVDVARSACARAVTSRRRARRSVRAGFAVWLLAAGASARDGFVVDRFDPAERGSDWFALESLDYRGQARAAVGVVVDYAHRPLVIYDATGNATVDVIEDELYAHVGGSLVLWTRLKLGANLPLLLVNEGDRGAVGTIAVDPATGAGVGDLRLSAEARILGEYGSPFVLGIGTRAYLPTGRPAAFSGDGSLRAGVALRAAGQLPALDYAAGTGFVARSEERFAGAPLGTEWTFAAAVGIRALERRLLAGPELYGSTVLSPAGSSGLFATRATAVELLLGAHYGWEELRFGVGVGPGLGRGLGTPELRLVAAVEWSPAPDAAPRPVPRPEVPSDRDQDGVADAGDACPDVWGSPAEHGCPPPPAPLPPDRDQDGVLDADDACPDRAGAAQPDPTRNGCPPPEDRDQDGVLDAADACPDAAGVANSEPSRNGCPLVAVKADRIEILERVEFELASATLRDESTPVLSAVEEVLTKRPDVTRLRVEGHTDDRGTRASNRALSQRRAEAVVAWLVAHGVAAERLEARGYGPDRPLASNGTEAGRQANRRVEFHIVQSASPAAEGPTQ